MAPRAKTILAFGTVLSEQVYWIEDCWGFWHPPQWFNAPCRNTFPPCPLIRPLTGGQIFATLMDINEHGRLYYHYNLLNCSSQCCRRWVFKRCKSIHKSFDLSKIWAQSIEIWANLRIGRKKAPNMVWFEKMTLNAGRITWRPFLEVTKKRSSWENICTKNGKIFRQVWGNWGKNSSHPQKFAYSYTYSSSTSWSLPWRCLFRSLPSNNDASVRRAVSLHRIFRKQPWGVLSCSAAVR